MNIYSLFDSVKICDSHLHLKDISDKESLSESLLKKQNYYCCNSSHSIEEYNYARKTSLENSSRIFNTFGIHPQLPDIKYIDFLEELLRENSINAIGEMGFDFYLEQFRQHETEQKMVFEAQLELALKYNKPVLVHGRKCIDKFYFYSKELSKLPSVVFHSFSGNSVEAKSLIDHNINCSFTLGKQLLNGNKKAVSCMKELPVEKLLLETDAPFQVLKGENYTSIDAIKEVYVKAFEIFCESMNLSEKEKIERFYFFCNKIFDNFSNWLNIC